MTIRKKPQPTEMEKALKLLDDQIKALEEDIERTKAQIDVLHTMRRSFVNLSALATAKKVMDKL